jgi:hypothetical protein
VCSKFILEDGNYTYSVFCNPKNISLIPTINCKSWKIKVPIWPFMVNLSGIFCAQNSFLRPAIIPIQCPCNTKKISLRGIRLVPDNKLQESENKGREKDGSRLAVYGEFE